MKTAEQSKIIYSNQFLNYLRKKFAEPTTFYEKAWASSAIISISFALIAANKMLGEKFQLEQFLSFDTFFVLFISCCCICYRITFFKLLQPPIQKYYFDPCIYTTEEERKQKSQIITKWMCDMLQYTIITTVGYYILKDTNFLPPIMFGKGHVKNCFIGQYDQAFYESTLKPYYLVQFGIHTYSLFFQVLGFGNNTKYFEYCFHHFLVRQFSILLFFKAFFLILFSFSLNEIRIGVLVMLIHDVLLAGDITYPLGRVYFDYKNKIKCLEVAAVLTMLISWIIARMIIYPFWIAKEAFIVTYLSITEQKGPYFEQNSNLLTGFFSFLLFMLIIMHYYWGIFMYFAVYTALVKKKSKFSYEKLNVNNEKK